MQVSYVEHDYTGIKTNDPIDWSEFSNPPPAQLRAKLQIIYILSKRSIERARLELAKINRESAKMYELSEPTADDFLKAAKYYKDSFKNPEYFASKLKLVAPNTKVVTFYQFELTADKGKGRKLFQSHKVEGLWFHPEKEVSVHGQILLPKK